MNILDEIIKCKNCKKIFKNPVFLPCGHSICKHHVDNVKTNKVKQVFCKNCDSFHDIPECGFVTNLTLESLLAKKIECLNLGNEYNSALDKCKQCDDMLERFYTIKNDPETRIHSVISDLRNEIDLRREELKCEIDRKALNAIKKLDEFEKECKSSINNNKTNKRLDEKLEAWKRDLDVWKANLGTFERNVAIWRKTLEDSSSKLKEILSELSQFEDSLFLNRLNEFNSRDLFIISDSVNTISLEVKELSKYKDIKKFTSFTSPHHIKAFGVQWSLEINLGSDTNIGVFLKPNKIADNMIVEYDVMIVNRFDVDKSIINRAIKSFDNTQGFGFKIIMLKDLMNDSGLYNEEKDSFTAEIKLKKVEWNN